MAISEPYPNQVFQCGGLQCTGTVSISIKGIRMKLTGFKPTGTPLNTCTCSFETTFQIRFKYRNITCEGGACDNFDTFLNGGSLWPGRWIVSSGCLAQQAKRYLDNCVTIPTFAGFAMANFLSAMGQVRPDCNGSPYQTDDGCGVRDCDDVPCS